MYDDNTSNRSAALGTATHSRAREARRAHRYFFLCVSFQCNTKEENTFICYREMIPDKPELIPRRHEVVADPKRNSVPESHWIRLKRVTLLRRTNGIISCDRTVSLVVSAKYDWHMSRDRKSVV